MVSAIGLAIAAVPLYFVYAYIAGLRRNIAAAKKSGLPYVIIPLNVYNFAWLVTHKIWIRLLRRLLPDSWTRGWLEYLSPDWPYQLLYEPFRKHGDVLLTVAPDGIVAWVANAEAISQITTTQRENFPKPHESYLILEVYGRNVITTEGADWRFHRRVTAAGFNEKSNGLVWKESIKQTQGMLRKWLATPDAPIKSLPADSLRATLNIICPVGFGVHLEWPGEERPGENKIPEGHTMKFEEALGTVLEGLPMVMIFPKWLLKTLPIKAFNKTHEAFFEWLKHMKELTQRKLEIAQQSQGREEGMDIMGHLLRNSRSFAETQPPNSKGSALGSSEKTQVNKNLLSDSDVIGNLFGLMLAGHETTANAVHFCLVKVAINLGAQKKLQDQITALFGNTNPTSWEYEASINSLLGGMAGAVLNEQLRQMPAAIIIPRGIKKELPEAYPLTIDGKKVILPKKAHVNICVMGVQHNPRYWPSQGPSKIDGRPDDINDFIPERWLVKDGEKNVEASSTERNEVSVEDELGGFTGKTTSAQLFHPAPCSYIPFSAGARSCLGRRIAQVELMAVLAVIFQKYSLELAVDQWATDEEVSRMSDSEKRELYKKASLKAIEDLKTATVLVTLKLHDGPQFIPIKIVPKGQERFMHVVDT